jgi:hypothetical protein
LVKKAEDLANTKGGLKKNQQSVLLFFMWESQKKIADQIISGQPKQVGEK